jgi:tetratricopeptide (TPR) repeat protein
VRRPALSPTILIVAALVGVAARLASAQLPTAALEEAKDALQVKDFQRAVRLFSELVKKDPSAPNFGYLGVAELSAGDSGHAIAHFRRSLELGNDSPNLHYYLGLAYVQHQELEAGIRELRRALSLNPGLFQAEPALGVALVNAGQSREALPYLDRALRHSSKDPEIRASLVRAEFEAGNRSQALASIDEAVDAIPDNPRLAATLAFLCLHHGQTQKARQLLENASELMPQDNTLKLLLADASLKAGEPLEALAVLKGVPQEAGAGGELAFLRGSAYLLAGNPQQAAPYLSAAVTADPANVDYLFAYAGMQGSEQLYADALATLKRARELDKQSASIPYQMAVTYALMHRYAEATQACDEALRLSTRRDDVYFLRGVIQLENSEGHPAEESFRQALASNAGVVSYHAALGVALFQMGELPESCHELDVALGLDPQAGPAYLWRARVLARQGQTAKAITDYETYIALVPDISKPYQELETLYRQNGQPEKAASVHAKYVSLKAEVEEAGRDPSFLDQLWLTRIREGLGEVASVASPR